MRIRKPWIFRPMSSVATSDPDELMAMLTADAEDRRRVRLGNIERARGSIAHDARVAAGTLENMRRQRSKGLRRKIYDRLAQFIVRDLQQEIARLESNLELAIRLASRPDADAIFRARSALAHAQELARELTGPKNSPDA